MQISPVARVYAEALLGAARDRGRIDELGSELATLAALSRSDEEVRRFLESPVIDAEAKKETLEAALLGRADELLVHFVALLIDKRRIGALPEIAAAYEQLADEALGRVRVRAATAVPLADDLQARLVELLQRKLQRECVLETEVHPDLLGGLVLTIEDQIYDGSVRGQLRRLRREMMRSSGYED